jgi:hypothetical protein
LVVWLSPNDWTNAGGYRYGTISFELDWESLIANKNFYWVGVMEEYPPPACRILITDRDRSAEMVPYDPASGEGPWLYDTGSGVHKWNGNYCLEIMLERPIALAEVTGLQFVKHHPKRCCIDYRTCTECGLPIEEAPALLVAELMGRGIKLPQHLFLHGDDSDKRPTHFMRTAWEEIVHRLRHVPVGGASLPSESSTAVMRAILGCLARKSFTEMESLTKLFPSEENMLEVCAGMLNQALDISGENALVG